MPINFIYKNTQNNLIAKIVHNQLSSLVAKEKMFNFSKNNFTLDVQLERKNIINFSLYIVCLCVTILRGNKEGVLVFEKLLGIMKHDKTLLKNEVKNRLLSLYVIIGTDLISRKKFRESMDVLQKGYSLMPNDRDLLASFSLSKYMNGFVDEAETLASILLANNTNFPVAHLDAAFFRIRKRKYTNALRHYLIFARFNSNNFVNMDAIDFFTHRIDEESQELGYLFARGFLKRLLNKDPKLSKRGETDYVEDLMGFVERAEDKIEYEEMVMVAKKYLKKYQHRY